MGARVCACSLQRTLWIRCCSSEEGGPVRADNTWFIMAGAIVALAKRPIWRIGPFGESARFLDPLVLDLSVFS